MRSIGCGFVRLLVIAAFSFLSACNSDKPSLEAQIKEDLTKVLSKVSQHKNLSKKLTETPPLSGMLSKDHITMYVWVKARATQMRLERTNTIDNKSQSSINELQQKANSGEASLRSAEKTNSEPAKLGIVLSKEEMATLNELKFSPELYGWVKQTIEATVDFVDAAGESGIADFVTFYDPVIKHNISLVNDFREKLQFANSVQLRVDGIFREINVTQIFVFKEKTSLFV